MAQYKRIEGDDASAHNVPKSHYQKEEHLEIDMFQREADLTHRRIICTKNPGHEQFIPIKEVCLGDLPDSLKHEEVLDYIKALAKLVVRIQVKHTSEGRHKDDPFHAMVGRQVYRGATGSVAGVSEVKDIQEIPCKDESCIQGIEHCMYGFIEIRTNRHVVIDAKEAQATEVEFFYDAPERMSVVCMKGYDFRKDPDNEHNVIVKCVTHDVDFLAKIRKLVEAAKTCGIAIPREVLCSSMSDYAISISHPHGQSKAVTVGRLLDHHSKISSTSGLGKRIIKQMKGRWPMKVKITTYTAATCMGCAGAPVITGYGEGWKWWLLTHSLGDLVAAVNIAFTS